MKTRLLIIIPIIVAVSIVVFFQTLITIDCLAEEGQPGLLTCTWSFPNFIIPQAFAEEQILIPVDNDLRKLYYTGENIISAFFDPDSSSIIFETGNNATLDVKAPKMHKHGEELFVLINNEEVDVTKESDECFYYVTLQTKSPGKIELIFAYWPEQHTKLIDNCENFAEESILPHDPYTEESSSTDDPKCGEGTRLVDGVCEVIDNGCEPDMYGNIYCTPQYDYLKIVLSEPYAFLFVFGIPSLAVIVIGVMIWRKRK